MALWSGRFAEETNQAVTDFTESISFDQRLWKYDIQGSQAHVAMLAEANIIPKETAEQITKELDNIGKRIEKGDFTFSAELEDVHMHIESALIDVLGDEGARIHTARSRNDQVALDIRLYLLDEVKFIISKITELQEALVDQGNEHKTTILPGFTHLQHAQPVLFAHHLLAYVEMFARDKERLNETLNRLNVMPLGSGALAGTTLPIQREHVQKTLNFADLTRNSMDSVADRDFACELLSNLAIFGMHISRLSEDLILWCSQEFNFVELGDAFCTGSSLMPQKKNPDLAEISRGKTGRLYGNLVSILTICKGLPLTYNRDLQEDKEPIFDSIDTVKKILSVFPPMIASMEVHQDIMLDAASDPALMATDLAEELVKIGVPFRHAHHRVGALVKWCKEHNRPLNDLTLDEMSITVPEATSDFLNLFTPKESVEKRDVLGGTGFKQVEAQLNFWTDKLKTEK